MQKRNIMLLRTLQRSRGSFFAAVAMIAVGLSMYLAMSIVLANLEDARSSYYQNSRFPDLFLEGQQIKASQVKKTAQVEGVLETQGRMKLTVPFLTGDGERVNVTLFSYSPEQPLNQVRLIQGTLAGKNQDDCLVLQQFAEARGIGPGDWIQVQINGRIHKLRICGVVESPEFVYLMENSQSLMPNPSKYGVVYINETLAAQTFGLGGHYNELLVILKQQTTLSEDQIITRLEQRLHGAGIRQSIKQKDQLSNSMLEMEFQSLKSMGAAIPLVFLGAAAVILALMLGRMVKQDRSRIGIMKAMGYSGGQVIGYYLKYSLLSGFVGGLVGIGGSFAMAQSMLLLYMDFFRLPYDQLRIYYDYCFYAVLLAMIFCGSAGIFGAKEAWSILPAQSMQAESPKKGRHILLERIPFLWRRMDFTGKMILKNIFRNKRRSFFSVAGMAVSFSFMLFSLAMPQVMDDLVDGQFDKLMTMDYNLSFEQPVSEQEILVLQRYLADEQIEGKLEYPFQLSRGHKEKAVSLIGIEPDSRFYRFQNPQGQALPLPAQGILITENLAHSLKVRTGDYITVTSYLDGEDYQMPVAGIVKQSLGMNGYLSLSYMGRMFLEPGVVNGAMLNSVQPEIISNLQEVRGITSILSNGDMKAAYGEYTQLVDVFVVFLVLLSGSLGFCIIYNSTIISLNEREREFSSMRVQGFTNGEIFRTVCKENFLLSCLGCVAGVPLSLWLCAISGEVFSSDLYTLAIVPSFGTVLKTIACAMLFLLVSQIITYRKISRLDFLQALKNRV